MVKDMIKKTFIMTITILVISLILVGCQSDVNLDLEKAEDKIISLNEEFNEIKLKNEELEKQIENLENNSESLNSPINLVDLSLDVMDSIKNNDMNDLSSYVHPSKGLRFTPYTNIDIQNDKVFTLQQVSALNEDNTLYSWGTMMEVEIL